MSRAQYFVTAGLTLVGLGLLFLLWQLHPSEWPWAPSCVFNKATGFHCAGCGATRATHYMLQGDWGTALRYNGLWVVSLPVLGAAMMYHQVQRRQGKPGMNAWPWNRLMLGLVFLVLGYWVLRNIPAYPFELLAPPE